MIKINLATKKRAINPAAGPAAKFNLSELIGRLRSGAGGGGGGGGLSMPEFGPQAKVWIVTGIVVGAAAFAADYFLEEQKKKDLDEVQATIATLTDQTRKLDSELGKTAGYETLKRNLEADERAIKTKIDTIERLIAERRDPPLILKTLSEVTPKEIWLTNFELKGVDVRLSGSSRGLGPVSDYMRLLGETVYFREVTLKRSVSKREQGIDVGQFDLEAKRK